MTRKTRNLMLALGATLLLVAGCGSTTDHGSAAVGVSTQALQASDVDRVSITVSGSHFSPDIVHDLIKVGTQWKGTIGQIPVGACTFTARAFDNSLSTLVPVYLGTASQTIASGSPAGVAIVLQQTSAPTPFSNSAPQISALTASATEVGPSGSVSLSVTATDPDTGDTLSYAWSDGSCGGTWASGTTAAPSWTAPASSGSCTLSVTVSDGNGGQTGLSLTVSVQSYFDRGEARMSLSFNTWPVVTQVSAAKGQVNVSESTTLSVTASDPDGDTLGYAWSDGSCGGTWAGGTTATPTWTAPATAPAGGTCTLTVTVSDGKGGSNSGAITITVGAPATPNVAPVIDSTMQSDTTVVGGATVTLRVVAHDPESQSLSFGWSTSGGTLGTASTTSSAGTYTSQVVWTAPTTAGGYTVTAAASDGTNSTSVPFAITVSGASSSWASSAGGSGTTDNSYVSGIAVDGSGNAFISGHFMGTAEFGSTTLSSTSAVHYDVFVARLDSSGAFQWAVRAGGGLHETTCRDIAVDSSGNIFITGSFRGGSTTFGSTTLSNSPGSNQQEIFVAGLNSSGVWQWATSAGGSGTYANDYAYGITVDSSGDLYITGAFQPGTAYFPTGSGSTLSLSNSHTASYDIFVAKLSSAGVWQWATGAGGTGDDIALNLEVDSGGAIYVTGEFSSSSTPASFGGSLTPLTSLGSYDLFVAKLSSGGVWQWANRAGSTGIDIGYGIAVDSSGNSYITGRITGTVTVGGTSLSARGANDVLVASLTSAGAWRWATNAGSSASGTGDNDGGLGITLDASGDPHITGLFTGTDATFGSTTLTASGSYDVFVAKLSSLGAWQWARSAGSTGSESGSCIAMGGSVPYVAGAFNSSSMTLGSTTLTNSGAGTYDVFVWSNP